MEDDYIIKSQGDNTFIVKALTPVEDFNEAFQTEFSDDEFGTIGGIVMHHFGKLPERDDAIDIDELSFCHGYAQLGLVDIRLAGLSDPIPIARHTVL